MNNIISRVIWPSKRLVSDVVREAAQSGMRVKAVGRGVLVFYPARAANQEVRAA